jgi:DnaJ-class molecular chaperone
LENVTKEAVQSAAMALRFLFNMESLKRRPSDQEERVTVNAQHTHGGEYPQICPKCKGSGRVGTDHAAITGPCYKCGGTGKLHHA